MKFIYFTKFWRGVSAGELAQTAKEMGADGLDLCLREGHSVNPSNVEKALPEAMKVWRDEGISVPMVTTEGGFVDPKHPTAEPILSACQNAGIGLLKLGYYTYQSGVDYWREVERIRWRLEGFERLGEKYDVCICYHTHSGRFFGSNASGLMHLIQGFNPRWIGAYLDTAHISLDGEYWAMALDIVGEYLKIVGMKSPDWVAEERDGNLVWRHRIVPFRSSVIDVKFVLTELIRVNFDGPLSFHAEYTDATLEERFTATKEDIALCRGILQELSSTQR